MTLFRNLKKAILRAAREPFQWYLDGTPSTGDAQGPVHTLSEQGKVIKAHVHAKTAPSGGPLTVVVGAGVDDLVTVTVPDGENSAEAVPADPSLPSGTELSLDVDAVNTAAGVTVTLEVEHVLS